MGRRSRGLGSSRALFRGIIQEIVVWEWEEEEEGEEEGRVQPMSHQSVPRREIKVANLVGGVKGLEGGGGRGGRSSKSIESSGVRSKSSPNTSSILLLLLSKSHHPKSAVNCTVRDKWLEEVELVEVEVEVEEEWDGGRGVL